MILPRPHRSLRALAVGLVACAALAAAGVVPLAGAAGATGPDRVAGPAGPAVRPAATSAKDAAACARPAAKSVPAVKAVDRAREVPPQRAGALATTAVRGAVRDELAAERQGEWSRKDGALWLDRCQQAFYVEPSAPRAARTTAGGTGVTGPVQAPDQQLFPLVDTFSLQSRPGAPRTLFLDFNGHAISGTAWNGNYGYGASASLPAYDYEGGGVFTDSERINIQNIWALVAEDYAPFDINVTTSDPGLAAITRDGTADTQYGTRAVITNDTVGQSRCGCGGIAYIGVFNNPSNHAYYQPALVFTRGVGHGAKNVTEALSHEVGHNLGLVHQGVSGGAGYYGGHGSWAPIMGVGYNKPISQWARGEYANASSTQDELAVMTATGAPFVADDHGNTGTVATPLEGALSAGVRVPGVVETPDDVDVFSFSLASPGDVTIDASPAAVGANLDIRAVVRDAGGAVVATVDPLSSHVYHDRADNLGAKVTLTGVAAGTYQVWLDGVGARNPATDGYSDYGSLGAYDLTVSAVSSDAPVMTSAAPGELTTSVAYRHAFTATAVGGGAVRWSLTGALPTGVLFDAATGTLSGKTTLKGLYPIVVTAVDAVGRETSRSYQLRSAGPLLAGSLVTRSAPVVGSGYVASVAASGGSAPYSWTAAVKPAWANVASTGAITGVPTTAGPEVFTLTVTDAGGRTSTRSYTASVTGPLVIRELTGRVGTAIGGTVTAGVRFSFPVPTYGGRRAYTFTPGALPAGVLMSTTGTVTGTVATPGTYPITATVRDYVGAQVTSTFSLRVVAPLVVAGTAPPATLGRAYSAGFTPTGGVAPYTVTATGVPVGMSFSPATGMLTGTPTVASTTSAVVLKVTDSVGRLVSRRVPLAVRTPVAITTTTLPGGSLGRAYSGRLTAVGGSAGFTWRLATGSLPTGMTLSSTGTLSGTPTTVGAWEASFTVTDSQGRTATTGVFPLDVATPVVFDTTALPVATVGQPYEQAVTASGGTGEYTFTKTTTLPAWLSVSADGVLSGTPPTATTVYVGIKVTDSAGRALTRSYALKSAL